MENSFNRVATTPERMREAMSITGKKQVDIVKATGIDKGSISNYLSGRYEPKQEAIYKIALALNVSEMWLWGYDVPMDRPQAQKNNDAIADIVVRLRTDENFLLAVKKIYMLEPEKLESLLRLLD
jgi:transcriptional regulator with XRE-family HTH domain